jgi:hypothetical protein
LVAVVVTMLVSCAAATAVAADTSIQTYPHQYALTDSTEFTVHGTPDGKGNCIMPGGSVSLAPDELAVEVRENSFDPDSCTATFEQGTPPEGAPGDDDDARPGMADAHGELGARPAEPAATAASAAAHRRRHRGRAALTFHARGHITTYYEDPIGIDVNKVNDGIDYYYNGNCVTSGSQWYDYHWYTPSGWGKNADNWNTANRCDLEASSSYGTAICRALPARAC